MGLVVADALAIGELTGDVHALGRAVITDLSGNDIWRADVAWQSRYYDPAGTAAPLIAGTDLTPLGSSTDTGTAIRNTDLVPTMQAIASKAGLTHKGDFRLLVRLRRPTGNTGAVSVQAEWGVGDYRKPTRDPDHVTRYAVDDREGADTWADLGPVFIPPDSDRWELRILASSTVAGDEIDVKDVLLEPTDGRIALSARVAFETPSAFSDHDELDQTAGSLAGKTSSGGKTWAEAGDAVRFSVETAGHTAQRTEVSDADENTGAYAVSGVAAFAAQAAQIDFKRTAISDGQRQAALARYADVNNWLRGGVKYKGGVNAAEYVTVEKRVAGTMTLLDELQIQRLPFDGFQRLRLQVDAAGRWYVWLHTQGTLSPALVLKGQDDALATGGALASGKPGFYDSHADVANPSTRNYDNFLAFAPTPDAAIFAGQSLTLDHQGAVREDPAGSFPSPVSIPRGPFLRIPPPGLERRRTRFVVKLFRNDPDTMTEPDPGDVQMQLSAAPRGLVVAGV